MTDQFGYDTTPQQIGLLSSGGISSGSLGPNPTMMKGHQS
jgi:hypothetical protein